MSHVLGSEDAVIVRSIIDLAHNLGMKVVAEGVEDAGRRWRLLVDYGCDAAQGYHFSRPMTAAAAERWFEAPRSACRACRSARRRWIRHVRSG